MNRVFYQLDNYKPIQELFNRWEIFSKNISQKPENMPIIIPDMVWKTPAGIGKTHLINIISEFLYSHKNIMDFYGDVKYFEFYLEYCSPNEYFSEIQRLMNEVSVASGFRNEYRGIIHIDVSEWVSKSKEKHFRTFLEYLSQNSDNWLIIISIPLMKDESTKEIEAIINSYLRIDTIILDMPSSDKIVDICCEYFSKYEIKLLEDARLLIKSTIDKLKENKYFDGFKTVQMLCQDIVYYIYSHNDLVKKPICAVDLMEFSSESNYTAFVISKNEEKARGVIGFRYGGENNA